MGILLLNLLKGLAGLALPAMLAMFTPRRWLVAALATWTLLPLTVLLLLFVEEMVRNPSGLAGPGGSLVALIYLGGFIAVPWLVMSVMGGAVGLALRRGRASGSSIAASPAESLPLADDASVQSVVAPSRLSQWRARHVGFERDGLILDGLDVWGSEWLRLGAPAVELPHPAHPYELHRFEIYRAGEGPQARQFAAAELSNGVWGFYTGVGANEPQTGTSTDGALGFENLVPGPDDRDRLAPTGRIWRIDTGEVVADGSAWMSSRVIPETDGSLLLALRHNDNDVLFRIHPETGTFSVVGERRAGETIDRLGEAVDHALRTSIDRAHRNLGLRLSPDGSIRVELAALEWSNSRWVSSPRVMEVASDRILLDLWGTDWDATASFPFERGGALELRRFHFGGGCQALLDLANDGFVVFEHTPAPPARGPLTAVVPAIEAAARRSSANAPRAETPRRVGRRQLLVALGIVIGALAAIGAVSFVTVRLTPEPTPKLSTIPAMPH